MLKFMFIYNQLMMLDDKSFRKCVFVFAATLTRSKINWEFVYLCIRSKDFGPISTISDYIQWAALAVCFFVFLCPHDEKSGGILIYPCPSVRPSGYRYMVCLATCCYSFGVTALILCRMFIHIMEVCMSTGFWFSSNIWWQVVGLSYLLMPPRRKVGRRGDFYQIFTKSQVVGLHFLRTIYIMETWFVWLLLQFLTCL
jgi:hypothetical protein